MITTPKLLDEVVRVPISEVHIIRKIGEGAFGEVSYANVESHGLVAVKWLKVWSPPRVWTCAGCALDCNIFGIFLGTILFFSS